MLTLFVAIVCVLLALSHCTPHALCALIFVAADILPMCPSMPQPPLSLCPSTFPSCPAFVPAHVTTMSCPAPVLHLAGKLFNLFNSSGYSPQVGMKRTERESGRAGKIRSCNPYMYVFGGLPVLMHVHLINRQCLPGAGTVDAV